MLLRNLLCDQVLLLSYLHRDQCPGVAHGNLTLYDHILHSLVQFEQAHGIGNGSSGLGDSGSQILLAQMEFLQKSAEGLCLFNRVQILSLDIFYE